MNYLVDILKIKHQNIVTPVANFNMLTTEFITLHNGSVIIITDKKYNLHIISDEEKIDLINISNLASKEDISIETKLINQQKEINDLTILLADMIGGAI